MKTYIKCVAVIALFLLFLAGCSKPIELYGKEIIPENIEDVAAVSSFVSEEYQIEFNSEPEEDSSAFEIDGEQSTTNEVWVSKTGKKYHSKQTCSNMKNPKKTTLEEAISRNLTPCTKCN